VNVALPTLGNDLKTSFTDLQWVVNAYTLTLAVLLVTAGRIGDLFGRKRLFMFGLGLFSLGSLLCAVSGNFAVDGLSPIQVLIAARVIQGAGGAIMLPLSLSIIAATFQGFERNIAIGIYGGVNGLAIAAGPIIGGLLVQNIGWQSIFYVNVPIGVIGIGICAWAVRESFDRRGSHAVDVFGLVTLTASLFCLVLALIQGNDADKGWTSPYILTLFAIAAAAMAIFIIGELRMKNPMLDLQLFANPSFTGAAIVAFSLAGGLFAIFFFISLYLQNYLGFTPFNAGLRTLPLSALIMVTAPIASAFVDRVSPKILMTAGMAMAAVAVLLMARIAPTDTQRDWVVLLPALVLGGLASGLVGPLISNVAVSTVSRDKAGMASGVSGVCRQVGIAFGIALLGALLTNWYNAGLHDKIARITIPGQPPAQRHANLSGIITALQNAGTFAGSTGLRNPPAQFAQFVHQPEFPLIQKAVQESYISATTNSFVVAALLLAGGTIASLVLIRRQDMHPAAEDTTREK